MDIFDNITLPSSTAGVSAGCGGDRRFSAHLWLVARYLLFGKILFFSSLKSAAYLLKYCNKSEGSLISHHAVIVVTHACQLCWDCFLPFELLILVFEYHGYLHLCHHSLTS